jgi:hypothetical protein
MMMAGAPLAFAASLWAVRDGRSLALSRSAVTLSTLQCLLVGFLMVIDLLCGDGLTFFQTVFLAIIGVGLPAGWICYALAASRSESSATAQDDRRVKEDRA